MNMPDKKNIIASKKSSDRTKDWFVELQQALNALPVLRYVHKIAIEDVWAKEHTPNCHELIHVCQGRARLKLGGREVEVMPDDTMLVPKGQPHSDLRISPGDYLVMMMVFDWPGGDRLLSRLDVRRLVHLPSQAKVHLRLLSHELERESLLEHPDAQHRASAVLTELVMACVRYCQGEPPKMNHASQQAAFRRRKQQMEAVRKYLQDNYAENIGLEQLAALHDINAFYLSRAFSQEFGVSITDMLASIRMEHARELLAEGTLSVKEIAFKVGYMNGNYFSKVFRRYYGLSPSEYQIKGK